MTALRVLHVITGLGVGGAETMLANLVRTSPPDRATSIVVSLTDLGEIGGELRSEGHRVETLGMRRGVPDPRGTVRLARLIRELRPDVVQTWMHHADLLGGLAARLAGSPPVIWGIRQSNFDIAQGSRRSQVWTARVAGALSRTLPAKILSCSTVAAEAHEAMGYDASRVVVIPNGFDTDRYRPDASAPQAMRNELGLDPHTPIVGLAARSDPQKDHRRFVLAARAIADATPAHFVLCGDGITHDNAELRGWIADASMTDRFHLLGVRRDMPRVHAAFDVAVSASAYREGFPNAIGEAMASGVVCVVTDVGDSAELVGDAGRVVAPAAPEALAGAVIDILRLPAPERVTLGLAARQRIVERYSLPAIVDRYLSLYESVVARGN